MADHDSTKTDSITLKWGTLKAWRFQTPAAQVAFQRYLDSGMSMGAMQQRDTPEQKALLCELIDVSNADTICLDWTGEYVSKQAAKDYILNYGTEGS